MKHIFFNLETEIEITTRKVFNAIGVGNILEGDSLNVLGGIYYEYQVFGCRIKLEQNSYDWDDEYKYMITVKRDILSDVSTTEENVKLLSLVIADLLHRNLETEIAIENDDKLEVYTCSS